MGSGEQKLIRQYGRDAHTQLHGKFAADDQAMTVSALVSARDEAVPAADRKPRGDMRLRHMFSTPTRPFRRAWWRAKVMRARAQCRCASACQTADQHRSAPADHGRASETRSRGQEAKFTKHSTLARVRTFAASLSTSDNAAAPAANAALRTHHPARRSASRPDHKALLHPLQLDALSPFSPVAPLRPYQHAQTQSQGQNIVSAESTAQTWSEFSPPPSSLLTPPLTGMPSLVFDHQPNTPASASATTPVKPTPLANRHKFDSLLAFLSSSEAQHATNDSPSKTGTEHSERRLTASPGSAAVVYGLAL